MPWADDVAGLVHAWYGGNENGNAIADILFGTVVPSGKMPMTFPERLEDVPSYGHFGSENGKVRDPVRFGSLAESRANHNAGAHCWR